MLNAVISPMPPIASLVLPWDAADAPEPVAALTDARAQHGDSFAVISGETTYFFVASATGLAAFYGVAERKASKGLADYRMLLRKLPPELFDGRRTFAHDLFGASDVTSYLPNVDWAIEYAIAELADAGVFDAFGFARRVGHLIGIGCWLGREAPIDALIADLDVLDGAEAFVHPERMHDRDGSAERAAMARLTAIVGSLLDVHERLPSFLDVIAERWSDVTDPALRHQGIAYDVVLLHIATMTNLFAAIGWTIAMTLLHDVADSDLDNAAFESIRLGQVSLMTREVLRTIEFDDGLEVRTVDPGVHLAMMVPITNLEGARDRFDSARWNDRKLHNDITTATFGHGAHRCPAQRFSMQAIVRTVRALRAQCEMEAKFAEVRPLPMQIGGVARAANGCEIAFRRVAVARNAN